MLRGGRQHAKREDQALFCPGKFGGFRRPEQLANGTVAEGGEIIQIIDVEPRPARRILREIRHSLHRYCRGAISAPFLAEGGEGRAVSPLEMRQQLRAQALRDGLTGHLDVLYRSLHSK